MAVTQPPAAYVALTKSLQCEWIYIQHVVPHCRAPFAPLENAISSSFLSVMFGCEVSQLEIELFSLPVHLGSLEICLPKHLVEPLYNASRQVTCAIVDSIKNIYCFELGIHEDAIVSTHKDYQQICDSLFEDLFASISSRLDPLHLRALQRARINDLKDTVDDDASKVLIADLCVRGVWLPQTDALFDIRVIDTNAQSYLSQPPTSVLFAAKTGKKRKYLDASVAQRAYVLHPILFFCAWSHWCGGC